MKLVLLLIAQEVLFIRHVSGRSIERWRMALISWWKRSSKPQKHESSIQCFFWAMLTWPNSLKVVRHWRADIQPKPETVSPHPRDFGNVWHTDGSPRAITHLRVHSQPSHHQHPAAPYCSCPPSTALTQLHPLSAELKLNVASILVATSHHDREVYCRLTSCRRCCRRHRSTPPPTHG